MLKVQLIFIIAYFYLLLLNLLLLYCSMPINETYNWNQYWNVLKFIKIIEVVTNTLSFKSIVNKRVSSFTTISNIFDNILLKLFFVCTKKFILSIISLTYGLLLFSINLMKKVLQFIEFNKHSFYHFSSVLLNIMN